MSASTKSCGPQALSLTPSCTCVLGAVPPDSVLTSAGSGEVSSPFRDLTARATKGNGYLPQRGLVSYQDYSPPCDLELIDGALAVVVVDEVLVTHPDALVVHDEALG